MAAMTWDRYLQFLMEVEEENIAEDYRAGRAMNAADEEMNRDVREGFDNLKAVLPTLLAAPDLLNALKDLVALVNDPNEDDISLEHNGRLTMVLVAADAAIAKAEEALVR